MNCKKCGAPLIAGDLFCKSCGAQIEVAAQNPSPVETANVGVNPTTELFNQPTNNSINFNEQSNSQVQPEPVQSNPVVQSFEQPTIMNQMPNSTFTQAEPSDSINFNTQPTVQVQPEPVQPNPVVQSFEQPTIMNQVQNNPYPTASTNNYSNIQKPAKKNDSVIYIVIAVLALVAVVSVAIAVTTLTKKDTKTTTPVETTSSYDVTFNGFKFQIPDDLLYEIKDSVLMIGDADTTWLAQIELASGNYSQIKNNMSKLQASFQSQGYKSTSAVEKTVDGANFITVELSKGGANALAAITKANSMYFIAITALNQDNEFDYTILNKLAPIVNSVTYIGESNKISSNIDIDITKISSLAK